MGKLTIRAGEFRQLRLNQDITTMKRGAFAIIAFLLLSGSTVFGSGSISVSVSIDTNQIRIGEQFRLRLTAQPESGSKIAFPVFPDTLHGLEVVERGAIDTLRKDTTTQLTLQQQLVLTSFDSGYHVIEPFIFTVQHPDGSTDSLTTEAMLLHVKTIQVDTTKAFKDIKPLMDPPFDWKELLPWIWWLLAIIAAAWAGRWLYRRYRLQPATVSKIKKPMRPAHEIALEELEKLEKEKLWQQGYHKEFHIRLTDIVRTYIEHRFGVLSQESTTDETLQGLRSHPVDTDQMTRLEQLLRLADLVKFAKAIPIITENEQSIRDVRSFILATAIVERKEELP